MLQITEPAAEQLAQMLSESDAPDDVAIRLVVDGEGVALRLDNVREGDTTFDHDGGTVLVLDEEAAELLASRSLDVEETEQGPQLALV